MDSNCARRVIQSSLSLRIIACPLIDSTVSSLQYTNFWIYEFFLTKTTFFFWMKECDEQFSLENGEVFILFYFVFLFCFFTSTSFVDEEI